MALILAGLLAAACLPEDVDERRSFPEECTTESTRYAAEAACQQGGERVVVTRVIDGDTLALEDGRQVQLVGIDAPELDECGGAEAMSFIRRELTDKIVRIYEDGDTGEDRVGRPLRYVRYGENASATKDLAHEMLRDGLVRRFPAYAGNPAYTLELEAAYQAASVRSLGIYGLACTSVVSPWRVADRVSDDSVSDDDRSDRSASERSRDTYVSPPVDDDDDSDRRSTSRDSGGDEKDEPAADPYPGYTGPRCYLPGGTTYRPC
ncbi:thermonuclease family protein [Pseudonocardia sp. RS010]|uniref:thermonuclease family protein n=1 Tax=Pseudonocardia sp. RS010 TaxID=3385979 RepID=UPI00399F99F3